MTTAIDTNILVALWNEDDSLNTLARSALDDALGRGGLVIAAPVFAELLAAPSRSEAFLDSFCKETGISVDWNLGEAVWRTAGQAFQLYVHRRRKQPGSVQRRIPLSHHGQSPLSCSFSPPSDCDRLNARWFVFSLRKFLARLIRLDRMARLAHNIGSRRSDRRRSSDLETRVLESLDPRLLPM